MVIGDVGVAAYDRNVPGIPRRVEKANLTRRGWVGHIDDAQPAILIGNVGDTARDRDVLGGPGRVVEADLGRRGRVGDVDDAQAAIPGIGDVGIAALRLPPHWQTRVFGRSPPLWAPPGWTHR